MGIIAAAEAATKSSGGNSSYTFLILILLVFVAVYFMMIRPQRRRQQAAIQTRNTVTPGAQVRTTAGMYATVTAVDGDDVVLEVAPGVEVRYMKRAIMEVIAPGEPEDAGDEPAADARYAGEDASDDDAPAAASAEDAEASSPKTGSAAEGLAGSHDGDLASSDRHNMS